MEKDETDKLFKSYRRGHDLVTAREQLNDGDDEILNVVAAANVDEEETAPEEN